MCIQRLKPVRPASRIKGDLSCRGVVVFARTVYNSAAADYGEEQALDVRTCFNRRKHQNTHLIPYVAFRFCTSQPPA